MMRLLLATLALTVVYALALASLDPWDLALGGILGLGVLLLFREFLFSEREAATVQIFRRTVHLPRLIAGTAAEIVRGTIEVAKVVLSPRTPRQGGFVAIPFGGRTRSGVIVSGLLNTLSPGSVLIDIDDEAETWTIHAIDATNSEALVVEVQAFYERNQRAVWP